MNQKITFNAAKRGESKAKKLRREGIVPANVYRPGEDSIALQFKELSFVKLYKEVGDSSLVYLNVDGLKSAIPVLIDEVSYDYMGKNIEHVVFRGVNLKEKVKANVAVELIGEFIVDDAVIVLVKDEVEVEALPADLPEKFEIDQSRFTKAGDALTLADLDFDKSKVELVLGEDEDPAEVTIVAVQEQREEEVEEVPEEPSEPEVIGEKKAEGEDVISGEEKKAEAGEETKN